MLRDGAAAQPAANEKDAMEPTKDVHSRQLRRGGLIDDSFEDTAVDLFRRRSEAQCDRHNAARHKLNIVDLYHI